VLPHEFYITQVLCHINTYINTGDEIMLTGIKIKVTNSKIDTYRGVEATTDGETWECDNPLVLRILEGLCSAEDAEAKGYTPNLAFCAEGMANLAIEFFGAEIVERYDDGYQPNYPVDARF
jgi:hypothetical protein